MQGKGPSALRSKGEAMGMTRKAFLGVGAAAVCSGAFGGIALALGGPDELLRPPVVRDEAEFASRCIRCYRCISVCPTGVLAPATLDDGLLAMKTPKVDFHRGYCDFCNKCVDVCPTRAIEACDPLQPSEGRMGYAVVQPDRCLAYSTGCLECEEACPYDAISLDADNRPVVNVDACNGCGMCEYVCPALVYRSFSGGTRRGVVVVKNEAQEEKLRASIEG